MQKKGNMSKYDIIQIIFKCCVSQMYLKVLLPNIKRTKLEFFIASWSYSYDKSMILPHTRE